MESLCALSGSNWSNRKPSGCNGVGSLNRPLVEQAAEGRAAQIQGAPTRSEGTRGQAGTAAADEVRATEAR